MKKILFLLSLYVLILNSPIYAQWEHLNYINGGTVQAITRDSSGYLFVSAYHNQIYRSSDNGNSWQIFTNDFPTYGPICFISTGNGTFAGTSSMGVYKTTNHGLNWFACNNGISGYPWIECFTLKDNFIFAGSGNQYIYRSSDNGNHWDTLRLNGGAQKMVVNGSVLYAEATGGSQGYMYKSTNNGANWILINNGLPGFSMDNLEKCGNRVYASNWGDGLFETTNEGDNWTHLTGGIRTMGSKGDTLVACYYSPGKTFYTTTNGGINWQSKLSDLPEQYLNNILWTPFGFIGTSEFGGIYKSTNLGLNWINISNGFTDVEIFNLTARNNIVLSYTFGLGTYRSTNYGLNWSKINGYVTSFIWKNNILYSFSGSYIMRSTDFGSTFIQQGNQVNYSAYIGSFAMWTNNMLPFNCFLVYTSSPYYIYRSTNDGINWVQSNSGLPSPILNCTRIFNKDEICFIVIERASNLSRSLFRSTNFGLSWDSIPNTSAFASVSTIIYNLNDYKFYLGKNNGVYTSTNLGNNWVAINNGLPSSKNVTSLFFNGDTIYASLSPGGIYRATIQNQTWSAYNDGLTNLNVNSVYGSNNYLYAGVTYGGFFRRQANIFNSVKNYSDVITDFKLCQNFPNPFNPSTNIKYRISKQVLVTLKIYDVLGKEIITLVNEKQNAGEYETVFDGRNLSSGIYFYKLIAGDFKQIKKMVLLK